MQSLRMNTVRDIMIGLGMIENLSFSLSQPEIQFSPFGLNSLREQALAVESSKSSEHVILRNSLLPSLLEALSRNIHEEYPQNLFEIGRVFGRGKDGRIIENWSIAAVFSSPEASYTDARRSVMTLLEIGFGIKDTKTQPSDSSSNYYVSGRAAELAVSGRKIGSIGEIKPEALVQLRLRMPTSAFEVDLSTAVGI